MNKDSGQEHPSHCASWINKECSCCLKDYPKYWPKKPLNEAKKYFNKHPEIGLVLKGLGLTSLIWHDNNNNPVIITSIDYLLEK